MVCQRAIGEKARLHQRGVFVPISSSHLHNVSCNPVSLFSGKRLIAFAIEVEGQVVATLSEHFIKELVFHRMQVPLPLAALPRLRAVTVSQITDTRAAENLRIGQPQRPTVRQLRILFRGQITQPFFVNTVGVS